MRKGVQVSLTVGESDAPNAKGPVIVCADREALLRALRNLVANAVQWSPKDGVVEVAIVADATKIKITVDDCGPGIPEEQREIIFEPFARGGVRGGERVGYGLGLAIVRNAIEAHDGHIEIATSPLGGARMVIELPPRSWFHSKGGTACL